jgi:hypothetical protein
VELENDQLRETGDAKQAEIERQLTVVKGLMRDVQKAHLRHDADLKELQRVEKLLAQKQGEIAIIRTKLHDRIQSLPALERVRTCLPPGPFGSSAVDVPCGCEDPCFAIPTINPIFLGSHSAVVE